VFNEPCLEGPDIGHSALACSHQTAIKIILKISNLVEITGIPNCQRLKLPIHLFYNNRVQRFHVPTILLVLVSSDPTCTTTPLFSK